MHFKRIFFRKVGKTSNQCGHLCIPIMVLLGRKRLAIVRQQWLICTAKVRQQWLICTAKESPKPYV